MFKGIALASITAAAAATYTPYLSGVVQTKESFTYGKFRAKVTGPNEKGTCFGFFSQWNGQDWSVGMWNSVEIELVPSLAPTPTSLDLSYGDGVNRIQEQNYDSFDAGNTAHVYEFTWTPNAVTFSADDKLLKSYQKGDPGVDGEFRD